MKKLIALLLALVCVLSLCVGCGSGKSSGGSGKDAKNVVLTIGVPSSANVIDYETNALTLWLEEQTGYDLKFHIYTGGGETTTQITTAAIGGEKLPDIIFGINMTDANVRALGKDGFFQDLTAYFQDRDGASKVFWDRLEENYSEQEIADIQRKMVDSHYNKIFYVPTMETSRVDNIDYQMWINQTWLDECNLSMPTDIDSLYNTLVAFKNKYPNCVPLCGSEATSMGGDVINWLINMYIYFNDERHFNIDDNGKVYAPFTTDEYREALIFVNKLYKEGLINKTVFSQTNNGMSNMITPSNGEAMVGIFAGHLTLHATLGSPVLDNYVSLPLWSGSVISEANYSRSIFITQDCKNPDAAFELIMTMWSEEASFRFRYGQEGVNWVKAEEGLTTPYGYEAKIRILDDPLGTMNNALWANACGGLNVNAEGESAIYDETNPALVKRAKMASESRLNADAAIEKYNPKTICPLLVLTPEESDLTSAQRNACADYYKRSRSDFIKGAMNPNSDGDWNAYVRELDKLGLNDWLAVAQNAYDRTLG